jgi:HEAT repeat protein
LLGRRVDDQLVLVLGGTHAEAVLAGRDKPYWLRVWGARGLLWAYDDVAEAALITALGDEHWRVREMACKVVARHEVGAAFDAVSLQREDEIARVRAAAARALSRLIQTGA